MFDWIAVILAELRLIRRERENHRRQISLPSLSPSAGHSMHSMKGRKKKKKEMERKKKVKMMLN